MPLRAFKNSQNQNRTKVPLSARLKAEARSLDPIVWLMLILFLFYIGYRSISPITSVETPKYDGLRAELECEQFISNSLKAPSSASFAPYHEILVSGQGDGPWTVVGWVEAQNAFSAKLRSSYVCVVEFSQNRAMLLSLSIK